VHAFVNDHERRVGTYLLGRRMYEVMVVWETMPTAEEPQVIKDFAEIWHQTDKVVYSTSLNHASSARTRIERDFNPEAIRQMKQTATRHISIGGPHLAAQALKAGLVDELSLFIVPHVVGAGIKALPDHLRLPLRLVDERRFAGGTVHLHYVVGP